MQACTLHHIHKHTYTHVCLRNHMHFMHVYIQTLVIGVVAAPGRAVFAVGRASVSVRGLVKRSACGSEESGKTGKGSEPKG
jgi:hypothetical protein